MGISLSETTRPVIGPQKGGKSLGEMKACSLFFQLNRMNALFVPWHKFHSMFYGFIQQSQRSHDTSEELGPL